MRSGVGEYRAGPEGKSRTASAAEDPSRIFWRNHVDEEQSTHDGRPEKRLPSGDRLRAKRKNELKESVAELEPRLADAAQAYSEKRDETTARQYQYPNERAYVYRLAVNNTDAEKTWG